MKFREYLEMRDLLVETSSGFEVTAGQVVEFIRECGPMTKVDLSGANITGRFILHDIMLDELDADNCNFEDGLEIRNCEFNNFLSFQGAYVLKRFLLAGISVGGSLILPQNIRDLQKEEFVVIGLDVAHLIMSNP